MLRKLIAILLAVTLVAAILPTAYAAEPGEAARIRREIESDYRKCLSATEKPSLGGFCGLMTSWQLYFMGVNKYLITADGNKQFDTYKNLPETTGGYHPVAYSGEDYSLRQALNILSQDGTRDVYNILVGFQETDTEAGREYGHAVVIYAILDGMVYFTEGFDTSMLTLDGHAICIPIDQFVWYYSDWTVYEGLIYFGAKDYLSRCTHYSADLIAEVTDRTLLLEEPRAMDDSGELTSVYRPANRGERLHVTGLYRNPQGRYYYEVREAGRFSYLDAERAEFVCIDPEAVQIRTGGLFEETLSGTISARYASMCALKFTSPIDGGHYAVKEERALYDLGSSRIQDFISRVTNGTNLISDLSVDLCCNYVQDGKLVHVERNLPIGGQAEPAALRNAPEQREGWFYDGSWHYGEDGILRCGWLRYQDADYYFDRAGAAVTGPCIIGGVHYVFSSTGLCLEEQPQ